MAPLMNSNSVPFDRNSRIIFFVILGCVMLARVAVLGSYPLLDPTEGRYADIPREMVETGNWITPQLEPGQPFWAKPPLSFWITAIGYTIFGQSEFSARFPSYLMGAAAAALTFYLAFRLCGTGFALLCTAILSTTVLFYVFSGWVVTDMTLTISVTLSLAAFPLAIRAEKHSERLTWGYLFFVGLGLSLLAKGLVGWILTGMPIFIWTLWQKQWGMVWKKMPWITGCLLTLAIGVPWHLRAETATPGFLDYYFIGEHFRRFFEPNWHGDRYGSAHEYPLGTIWAFALIDTIPWNGLWLASLLWLRKQGLGIRDALRDEWISYLLFWFVTPLVFFTMARNIVFTYILPGLPAFSILTGYALLAVYDRLNHKNQTDVSNHRATDTIGSVPWFLRNKVIVPACLFTPVVFTIVALTILPEIAHNRSQKELVEAFLVRDPFQTATLVYTDEMAYSADFYANGRAVDIPDESQQKAITELHDSNKDFYAIKDRDLDNFPPEGFSLTKEIGRFGRYVLREETQEAYAHSVVQMHQDIDSPWDRRMPQLYH